MLPMTTYVGIVGIYVSFYQREIPLPLRFPFLNYFSQTSVFYHFDDVWHFVDIFNTVMLVVIGVGNYHPSSLFAETFYADRNIKLLSS